MQDLTLIPLMQDLTLNPPVFNVFIEPQVSVADKGAGWPKWQIFCGLNTQFK